MTNFLGSLEKITVLLDTLDAAAEELANPNTPDDYSACIATSTKAFTAFGVTDPSKCGRYFADVILAMAGGQNAVDRIMADFTQAWNGALKTDPPKMVTDMLREFLADAEEALREYRAGKPLTA